MGEDPGSEVEPRGHEHEVELRLFICCIVQQFFTGARDSFRILPFFVCNALLISSRNCLLYVIYRFSQG